MNCANSVLHGDAEYQKFAHSFVVLTGLNDSVMLERGDVALG